MANGELASNKPNQAKKMRGYILKTFNLTGKKPLQIYSTTSRTLIRDKVIGNKKRRVLMLDEGGLPLLFIPKERLSDFQHLLPLEGEQFLTEIVNQVVTMRQVEANNYAVAKLTSVQANLLTKIGEEVAGKRELEN